MNEIEKAEPSLFEKRVRVKKCNLSGIINGEKTRYKKGHIPWIKGKGHSEETKLKISLTQKGKKRRPHSEETREKIRQILTGVKHSKERRRNQSLSHIGLKCPAISGGKSVFWKGGITPINKKIKNSSEYKIWRKQVFIRDDWTCQECGTRGGELHPHHIKTFSQYPKLRFNISNGITLCKECHKKTDSYGNKKGGRRG